MAGRHRESRSRAEFRDGGPRPGVKLGIGWPSLDPVDVDEATPRSTRGAQPERLLMAAVLEDAIRLVRKYPGEKAAEERAWFARRDGAEPFSFVAICEALGLSATAVRRTLSLPAHPPRQMRSVFSHNAGNGHMAIVRPYTYRIRRGRPKVERRWGCGPVS